VSESSQLVSETLQLVSESSQLVRESDSTLQLLRELRLKRRLGDGANNGIDAVTPLFTTRRIKSLTSQTKTQTKTKGRPGRLKGSRRVGTSVWYLQHPTPTRKKVSRTCVNERIAHGFLIADASLPLSRVLSISHSLAPPCHLSTTTRSPIP
jgi:hypothetical protein